MSTHIVQIAYKKSLEMFDFVPIFFLKTIWWRFPSYPPFTLIYCRYNTPPPQISSKIARKKKKKNPPPLSEIQEPPLKNWFQRVEQIQSKMGWDRVSGGVSVPCRYATR